MSDGLSATAKAQVREALIEGARQYLIEEIRKAAEPFIYPAYNVGGKWN